MIILIPVTDKNKKYLKSIKKEYKDFIDRIDREDQEGVKNYEIWNHFVLATQYAGNIDLCSEKFRDRHKSLYIPTLNDFTWMFIEQKLKY
jgi:hypothetical protein